MKDESYAHSREGKPPEEWHRLVDDLNDVAKMARAFADDFQSGEWGYLAGLWHNVGNAIWPMLRNVTEKTRIGANG